MFLFLTTVFELCKNKDNDFHETDFFIENIRISQRYQIQFRSISTKEM